MDTGQGDAGYQNEIAGPSGGSFQLITIEDGKRQESTVAYRESDWLTYYKEIANHLLRGSPVPVTGEDSRRTIAAFEAAERASRSGRTESVAFE